MRGYPPPTNQTKFKNIMKKDIKRIYIYTRVMSSDGENLEIAEQTVFKTYNEAFEHFFKTAEDYMNDADDHWEEDWNTYGIDIYDYSAHYSCSNGGMMIHSVTAEKI